MTCLKLLNLNVFSQEDSKTCLTKGSVNGYENFEKYLIPWNWFIYSHAIVEFDEIRLQKLHNNHN